MKKTFASMQFVRFITRSTCLLLIYASSPTTAQNYRLPCQAVCGAGTSTPGCDPSCTPNSSTEIYPRNAYCNETGFVMCDKCHIAQGRSCVRSNSADVLPRGSSCSDDCQCDTGLSCRGVCTCLSSTYRFNPENGHCIKREYLDECQADEDCKVFGGSTEGFTYSGGVCSPDKQCQCDTDNGYVPTQASFIDPVSGDLFTKTICVLLEASVDVELGKVCSLEPIGDSEDPALRVCAAGTACITCPEEEVSSLTSNEGKCRSLTRKLTTARNQECGQAELERTSNSDKTFSKVGKLCFRDSDCGRNEVCEGLPVKPACFAGFCSCLPCHAMAGQNSTCSPIKQLSFGDPCFGYPNERLPENGICLADHVACPEPRELTEDGRCMQTTSSNLGYGESCSISTSCSGELTCSSELSMLGYGDSFSICTCKEGESWSETEAKCITPDGLPPKLTCEDIEECSKMLETSNAEVVPENCNEIPATIVIGTVPTSSTLEPSITTAAFGNETPTAIVVDTSTTLEPPMTTTLPIDISTPILGGASARVCSINVPSTVGTLCTMDQECGACEVCVIPRGRPVCCQGTCQCRHGYAKGPSGKCEPIRYLELGTRCSGADDAVANELLPTYAVCSRGRVQCNIFTQRIGSACRRRSLPGIYGSRCLTSLDCLGGNSVLWCDRDLQKCVCYDTSQRMNEHTGRCETREFGDPCTRPKDCKIFATARSGGYTYGGGVCNLEMKRCQCNTPSFKQAIYGFMDPHLGLYVTKTICVHSSSILNARLGELCTIDPIFYGNSPLGRVRICLPGLFCSRCPGDGDLSLFANMTNLDGICRRP